MKSANYAAQWEQIRWAIQQGAGIYDFAGTACGYPPNPAARGYGVYQFKSQFGAEIVVWYGYADLVFSRARYRLFRRIEELLPRVERAALAVRSRLGR